ncbi:asparagine synthase (glutamine-hydrolyzing) [Nonomuraea sp. NPDC046570]|uniref:asparagine synthase (glutamine-hydrolyzing) n=1 Tax=Nonomuraea sp. NPDC046570 TaxID=3155255 RepID=UPI0034002FF8
MCGIAGWVDRERDLRLERETGERMTATMACRGPDDEGLWAGPHALLGHRRLAIIDLEGGVQPMREDAGAPVVLVFSGEVYNFTELREELRGRGHRFTTRSDTEVVLRAYLTWGVDAVRRLNGMFAFAIWDGRSETLLLARDRLGIKPLYYAESGTGLLFGSEPKAILAHPGFEPEIDEQGLAELVGMWPFTTPGEAVYRGMRELLPGHVLVHRPEGTALRRYWHLESRPHTDGFDETTRNVRDLLEDAVGRQLIADVQLCTLVSGGLDSSTITALAAGRQGNGKLATFSVDYRGSRDDFQAHRDTPTLDAPYVARMVEHLGTQHTDVVLDTGDMTAHEETVVRARDLPSMGNIDISLLLLFRAVRRQSTVALSGESADEVFGGYPWHTDPASGTFPWLVTGYEYPWLHPTLVHILKLKDYVRDRYSDAVAEVPRLAGESAEERSRREITYLGLTRHLPALLNRKDRMSMTVGLEVRVPYCDHRLVEYMWNVPWEMKAAGGQEKALLRHAATGLLPEEVRSRTKSRYPSPQGAAYQKAVWDRIEALLHDRESPLRPLLNVPFLTWLVDRVRESPASPQWTMQLSSFLSFDTWLRMYKVRIR